MYRYKFAALTAFGLLALFVSKPSQAQWVVGNYVATLQSISGSGAGHDSSTPSVWAITTTSSGSASISYEYSRQATWTGPPGTQTLISASATGNAQGIATVYSGGGAGCHSAVGSLCSGAVQATNNTPQTYNNSGSATFYPPYYPFLVPSTFTAFFDLSAQAGGDEGYATGTGTLTFNF